MRLNDATPADWDRVRNKRAQQVDEHYEKMQAWMKAAHDESSEAWEATDAWEEEEDVVNNPEHYNTGNIECIDAIEESMSSVAFKGYLKGNCIKYLWRYEHKGKQVEDLEKAGWYLNKLTDMVAEENN